MDPTSPSLNRNKAYKTYLAIQERILNQEYKFGERINIDKLSRELSVSNNPIREALAMLERDGLIDIIPNSGARVIEFTSESFRELTETLEILISGGYRLCVAKGNKDILIAHMRRQLTVQKAMADSDLPDADFARAAIKFDECFIKVTGNARLIALFDELMNIFLLASVYDYQHGHSEKKANISEHQEMLEAIESGDDREVMRQISNHYNKEILFQ